MSNVVVGGFISGPIATRGFVGGGVIPPAPAGGASVGAPRRRSKAKSLPLLARPVLREITLIAGVGRFVVTGQDAELIYTPLTREQQIARRKKASEAVFLMLAA